MKVFESSGILRPYLVRPLDWYLKLLGWSERNEAYLKGACALFVEAASNALADAVLSGADIDTVVTVSSTGLATPGIDARVGGPDFLALAGYGRDISWHCTQGSP